MGWKGGGGGGVGASGGQMWFAHLVMCPCCPCVHAVRSLCIRPRTKSEDTSEWGSSEVNFGKFVAACVRVLVTKML